MTKSINILAIILAILLPMNVQAGGSISGSFEYDSGGGYGGPVVVQGAPVVIHTYPNGRVVVQRAPVTHVYPRGESLIYQNGGQRVYSQGYGGAGTCYVSCWQNGVRPGYRGRGYGHDGRGYGRGYGRGNGTRVRIGVGISTGWNR